MIDSRFHKLVSTLLFFSSFLYEATSLSTTSSSTSPTLRTTDEPKYASHHKTKIASSVAKAERREKERNSSLSPRSLCERCSRPPILCICESLPDKLVSTSTHVLVLQHPREFRRKTLSTVPLMPLVLENCTIKRGYNFEPEDLDLVQDCIARGKKPLMLFPGKNAISLDSNKGDVINNDNNEDSDSNSSAVKSLHEGEQLLILIDGTWAEARRMIMQSKRLMASCQQIQFTADYDSIYDVVRKEPEKHCISTLEACAHALTLLEPDDKIAMEAKQYLEGAMQFMVDTKVNVYNNRNPEPRFTRPGTKIYEKNKRRNQIKEQLFKKK